MDIFFDNARFANWLSSQKDNFNLCFACYCAAYRMIHNSNIIQPKIVEKINKNSLSELDDKGLPLK